MENKSLKSSASIFDVKACCSDIEKEKITEQR